DQFLSSVVVFCTVDTGHYRSPLYGPATSRTVAVSYEQTQSVVAGREYLGLWGGSAIFPCSVWHRPINDLLKLLDGSQMA
ncbi:hypothetical protein, partial [Sphingobium yanoikuyae]|uniref:hypothetical protein n=1 Tax=Sphingobium yanoikuyae TaxID=13690 RepID=UPI001BDC9F10